VPTVAIDCFHEHLPLVSEGCSIVAVDVVRAATTAVTAAALGRRCFPVPSIEAAVPLAARLENPLLAGELGGAQPYGFHMQNSPAEVARRNDHERPMILLSTAGTRLMDEAALRRPTYLGALRNHTALTHHLLTLGGDIVLLGAASRGEFREEDQLCCARIGARLVEAGFAPWNRLTEGVIERWRDASDDAWTRGPSAEYLRMTGQDHDLEFIIDHVDDMDDIFRVEGGEVKRSQ
jgi:2-phosphosulfolactate phosphatase